MLLKSEVYIIINSYLIFIDVWQGPEYTSAIYQQIFYELYSNEVKNVLYLSHDAAKCGFWKEGFGEIL